jgi:hypothetical protein
MSKTYPSLYVRLSSLHSLPYADTVIPDNEDAEKTCELIGLIGCALLTVLSAIDRAGQLKPNSRFLDLALVIG